MAAGRYFCRSYQALLLQRQISRLPRSGFLNRGEGGYCHDSEAYYKGKNTTVAREALNFRTRNKMVNRHFINNLDKGLCGEYNC